MLWKAQSVMRVKRWVSQLPSMCGATDCKSIFVFWSGIANPPEFFVSM